MPIQILSEIVAAQIAAGEVVDRPAAVVKELIENALDAGATLVQVESESGGRRLLRITDNGSGIAAHEAELAFTRHATSKLQSVDDLTHINTLGFRGEALASVASVAQVTMLTRTADEDSGTLIRVRGGNLVEQRAAGAPVGTVITVENLFFNTPARLKFLKSETTERRHIDALVTRYAMAYPNVRFSLMQDNRLAFQTTGNGSLADVLVEALGLETMHEMLEVTPAPPPRADLPPIMVSGYTSAPTLNRTARNQITLFVNGRYIQDGSLTYAVSHAYHTLMPSERYPVSVLLITMPPEEVDVNVHPTKAEVRFHSPDAVFSAVQNAVRRSVIGRSPVPNISGNGFNDTSNESYSTPDTNGAGEQSNGQSSAPPTDADGHSQPVQHGFDLPVPDTGYRSQQYTPQYPQYNSPYANNRPGSNFGSSSTPYEAPTTPYVSPITPPPYASGQNVRSLPPLRVLGQVAATYIVAEGPAGMYLVDQHAAHERILYEQFMAQQTAKEPIAQRTLDAITVELTSGSALLIEEHLDTLTVLGFEIAAFGKNTFQIRAVPAMLADRAPEASLRLILEDLENADEPGDATLEARIILRVCKASAVKAGQTLSFNEMQAMLRQLERCAAPRTCPHGRPTMIHMSSDQLAKEFGRT